MEGIETIAYIFIGLGIVSLIEYWNVRTYGEFKIYFFNNWFMKKWGSTAFGKAFFNKERLMSKALSGGIVLLLLGAYLLYQIYA